MALGSPCPIPKCDDLPPPDPPAGGPDPLFQATLNPLHQETPLFPVATARLGSLVLLIQLFPFHQGTRLSGVAAVRLLLFPGQSPSHRQLILRTCPISLQSQLAWIPAQVSSQTGVANGSHASTPPPQVLRETERPHAHALWFSQITALHSPIPNVKTIHSSSGERHYSARLRLLVQYLRARQTQQNLSTRLPRDLLMGHVRMCFGDGVRLPI
ncbi:uncharacterized protein EV422DRAFT_541527 [Fimicolochytrium jonesii]|uniref:uncharacterized protein n=1 Tax=Fimicolochytrium jonesii TaxID=1396493 RepID=UPI0022FDFBFE|nr:uncharacterized protein EV422DRAFT_541527 [Fimicolochytrium jonesii]KAI8817355.1 hypothetical protein EV422DRAFT_541527 [Fimicolochytrium jonesii]